LIAEESWFDFRYVDFLILFPILFIGHIRPLNQCLQGVKLSRFEAGHLRLSSTKVNVWSYIFTPTCTFVASTGTSAGHRANL